MRAWFTRKLDAMLFPSEWDELEVRIIVAISALMGCVVAAGSWLLSPGSSVVACIGFGCSFASVMVFGHGLCGTLRS